MHLHLGYFGNFKGADTILMCGDEKGLATIGRPLADS